MPITRSSDPLGQATLRKVARRLLPFLCLLYAFNILDRANVGFARTAMEQDLGMTPQVFDLGYGLFYIGYLVFEVPSNLLLHRVGARRWIGRIMISWGLISCATAAVNDAWSFYLIRILLGVAEAGFFPGIILYLTYWFPARERARMTAYFMLAIALASVFGNPLSGAIMQHMAGVAGLKGWHWMFLLEGLPSVLLGISVLYLLPDRPGDARWLADDERTWLVEHLRQEEEHRQQVHRADRLVAMLDRRVWLLICLYFTVAVGANAAGAHVPKLVEQQFPETDRFQLGLLTALPHLCAILAMTLFSVHSDRTGERRLHVCFAALLAACGWSLSALSLSPGLVLLGFCLAQAGMMSMLPVFWTLPPSFLSGAAAAGGIALINSVANIGGFFGPTILGQLGLWSMVFALLTGAALAVCVRPERPKGESHRA
jgi:ACS family tartrate transporter-like MFS transporter